MKKLIFTFLFIGIALVGWSQESYTALKVKTADTPIIDGAIDDLWKDVTMVSLTKVPEVGGVVHSNITVPSPTAADFSAKFGVLWNDDGIFFLFRITDDNIVIEEDYYLDNEIAADKWWADDNMGILFSKDLVNTTFEQFEFAYQPGVDQEEKLSSDLWANPHVIAAEMVQAAWEQDGDVWTLETFIDWDSFDATITPGMDIAVEMRARDDDDSGDWESMYQWSTINYAVEDDGVGLGTVSLSTTELEVSVLPSAIKNISSNLNNVNVYPNPVQEGTKIQFNLTKAENVNIELFDICGSKIASISNGFRNVGEQIVPLNMSNYTAGTYLLMINTGSGADVLKITKQ